MDRLGSYSRDGTISPISSSSKAIEGVVKDQAEDRILMIAQSCIKQQACGPLIKFKAIFLGVLGSITSSIVHLIALKNFGKSTLGKSRNIAKQEVLSTKEDYQASLKLLDNIKALQNQGKLQNVTFNQESTPESSITDGICAGIRLDIAMRYFGAQGIPQESIEEIIKANKKGASAEAAANQAIYTFLSGHKRDLSEYMESLIDELEKNFLAVDESRADQIVNINDFKTVRQCFAQVVPYEEFSVLKNQDNYQIAENTPNNALQCIIRDIMKKHDMKMKIRSDSQELRKAVNDVFEKKGLKMKNEEINILELTISLLECTKFQDVEPSDARGRWAALRQKASNIFKSTTVYAGTQLTLRVTNPIFKQFIKETLDISLNKAIYNAVAEARGLKVEMSKVMGLSVPYASDEDYLQNLPKLTPGFYSVNFDTGKGAHAISYIKNDDEVGSGYILDPNGFQIKCDNPEDAMKKMGRIIGLYRLPKSIDQHPLYKKGYPHHMISIDQISLIT